MPPSQYRVFRWGNDVSHNEAALEARLNAEAAQGFRFVGMAPLGEAAGALRLVVLERLTMPASGEGDD